MAAAGLSFVPDEHNESDPPLSPIKPRRSGRNKGVTSAVEKKRGNGPDDYVEERYNYRLELFIAPDAVDLIEAEGVLDNEKHSWEAVSAGDEPDASHEDDDNYDPYQELRNQLQAARETQDLVLSTKEHALETKLGLVLNEGAHVHIAIRGELMTGRGVLVEGRTRIARRLNPYKKFALKRGNISIVPLLLLRNGLA
ncbi:hypothetical protein LTS18_006305 [Coniosporium uncinatum]|uniref:Uncharacterized protein n=1 Tax=Coniosporium uncinatum TaxID=93489 RepID=A0ACC3DQW6_9PEZI|nr:hypothetical protein LTS18_006305 [Coniosporium uncinatum]